MLLRPLVFEPKRRWLRFISAARRFVLTLTLLFACMVAASAYTVVMRGGRHIEIPENFIVTRTTLTYEAASGINVTLQLSTIDIPATERINNEPVGSLLRRAHEPQPRAAAQETTPARTRPSSPARRTITNRDLEASRRAREESDEAYERRAQELGLPSLEEARRRNEEETQRLLERSRRSEEEEAQAEIYWRSRATELRTEFAVVDAQLNYLRNRLAQQPRSSFTGSYTVVTGVAPFFPFRPRGRAPQQFPRPINSFGLGGTGAQTVGVIGFGGGSTRGQVLVNVASPWTNSFGRHQVFSRPRLFAPHLGLYAPSYQFDDSSSDRAVLVSRLHELEAVRAGLEARWRLLEDEARRAGASPGWLRP